MEIFESVSPEAILQIMNNFDKSVIGTGTTSFFGKITLLQTLLQEEALREYELIITIYGVSIKNYLLAIKKGLTKYFFPSNALAK